MPSKITNVSIQIINKNTNKSLEAMIVEVTHAIQCKNMLRASKLKECMETFRFDLCADAVVKQWEELVNKL